MTKHCLISINALYPSTGERSLVRLCGANLRELTGLGGVTWFPAVTKLPSMVLRLFEGDFSSAVSPGAAEFTFNLDRLRADHDWIDRLDWAGATVEIYAGAVGDEWPWQTVFSGVTSGFDRQGDKITLSVEVNSEPFEADVLTDTYAGTTGAEGPADLKNQVKPLVIGHAKNVEPVLIDAVNNVYQFSGYGAIEEVTEVFERGGSFGSPVANYSSYANLVAATIANGKYATCLAEGMVRFGAPAYGVITGDIKGHKVGSATPRYTGEVIALLADLAGIDADLIEDGSLDALDAAVPYPINLVLNQQSSFMSIAQSLALSCNAQSGVSLTGKFFVARAALDATESIYLEGQGRALPLVKRLDEKSVSAPFKKITMGADRAWRVHTLDEISYYAALVDKGDYNASTTYREGDIVSLPDGSRWLYTSTTPSSGHEPPNVTYWEALSGTIEGVVTNVIYKKSATQPSTPSDSSGVPSGWVDDYSALPGTDLPVWACFGRKPAGEDLFEWSTPYPMLADLRTYEGLNDDGTVVDDGVSTPAIVDNGVNSSTYAESSSVINFASATKTTIISFSFTKDVAGSVLKLQAQLGFLANDAIDGILYLEILSGSTVVRSRTQTAQIDCNGTTQLPLPFVAFFSGLAAGTYTARVSFERNTGNAVSTNGTSHLEVTEQKK